MTEDWPQFGPIECAAELLEVITGCDFSEEHMRRTPERWTMMMKEMTTRDPFEFTVFPNEKGIDEMVVEQDIRFYSLCAHHLVPFFGFVHIAYIPADKIAGLSKLPRTVDFWSKGLWTQEDLTHQIADFLEEQLDPKGVAVVMKGEHLCQSMRGAKAPGITTTTSAMRGVFLDPSKQARAEFFSLINGGK